MKNLERKMLRRKKKGHFSPGQEVRVWGDRRKKGKMMTTKMVSFQVLLCCKIASATDRIAPTVNTRQGIYTSLLHMTWSRFLMIC